MPQMLAFVVQEVAPVAVLSDWEMQARALPSNAAWGSFPQLLGSALARDNLLSPSSCKEVLSGCCEPENILGKTKMCISCGTKKICLSLRKEPIRSPSRGKMVSYWDTPRAFESCASPLRECGMLGHACACLLGDVSAAVPSAGTWA